MKRNLFCATSQSKLHTFFLHLLDTCFCPLLQFSTSECTLKWFSLPCLRGGTKIMSISTKHRGLKTQTFLRNFIKHVTCVNQITKNRTSTTRPLPTWQSKQNPNLTTWAWTCLQGNKGLESSNEFSYKEISGFGKEVYLTISITKKKLTGSKSKFEFERKMKIRV